MSQLLEPRETPALAWKRWLKVGARLGVRQWLTLLPLSLVLGLAGGWLSAHSYSLGLLALTSVSGVWQAMLLHTAERSAAGKRVDLSTAWEGLMIFWKLPAGQALQQIKARAITSVVLACAMLLVLFLPLYLLAINQAPPEPTPVRETTSWMLLLMYSSTWSTVFLWAWLLQRGGCLAMTNMLVRRYQLDWETAHRLQEKAMLKNRHNFQPLSLLFIAGAMLLFFAPWTVFFLELLWVSVVTVMGRDIFEHKEGLESLEARATSASLASAR